MHIPKTKKENIIENINGVPVADPYRWLENGDDTDVKTWVEAQNQYTDSVLRNKCQKRFFDELTGDLNDVDFYNPVPANGRYFYIERQPNENQSVLYMKDGLDGTPVRLVDPNEHGESGMTSLDYWKPGWAGNYVAYGLSEGGDEMATLCIMDVDTRENLHEQITNCVHSHILWLPDDSGFFYTRNPRPETVPIGEERLHVKVYFHELGKDPDDDKLTVKETFRRLIS